MAPVDPRLLDLLACPWDGAPVRLVRDGVACDCGRRYNAIDGIPIMLRDDVRHTHEGAYASLRRGLDRPAENAAAHVDAAIPPVDAFVQEAVAATNGLMYRSVVGRLREYPIPTLRLPPGNGQLFLDVGSNWGRWVVAAARQGYAAVGLDPQIEALLAAQRVTRQLGLEAAFVCGDARYMPFRDGRFHVVFSYSVLQHFSRDDVVTALAEFRRVLRAGGQTLVQMPNAFGLRCLYHQARRGLREARDFEVRYWTPRALLERFGDAIGPTSIGIDGFLSINAQTGEMHILPRRYRATIRVSRLLRKAARRLRALTYVADSLYVSSTKA